MEKMRYMNQYLYDRYAHRFWLTWGFYENQTHLIFLQKFLQRIGANKAVLSAACGAGRYDGLLLEAGHSVLGIDQSAGVLARAWEHFTVEKYPRLRYEQVTLQEMGLRPAFQAAFDGVICIDAMEHVCPEDWPGIMEGFARVLKPGGRLYFTLEEPEGDEIEASYARAKAMGLPVVYGELADEVEAFYQKVAALSGPGVPDELGDPPVYHYYPSLEQARSWISQAGLVIEEEGSGHWYHHFLAIKVETP